MKITKEELNKIIKEELDKTLEECGMMPMALDIADLSQPVAQGYMGGDHGMSSTEVAGHGEVVRDPDGYEGSMAKSNLRNAAEDAMMLTDMIQNDENLEPWVEEKIAVASSMLNSVARYMKGGRTR